MGPLSMHLATRDMLWRHTGFLQLVMEGTVGVLKPSVTMKERMGAGIGFHSPVKGPENQRIVIPVTYDIGDNTTVIEVEDGTEKDLVHLNALIPSKLRDIGRPFLIWLVRMEVAAKNILSYILRILCPPRAAVVTVLDGGLDALGPADTENALVIHVNMFIVPKVVIDAAVAFIRVLHVDLLDLLCDLLVLQRSGTQFTRDPTKTGSSGNVQQLTGCLNRVVLLCMAFLYSSV